MQNLQNLSPSNLKTYAILLWNFLAWIILKSRNKNDVTTNHETLNGYYFDEHD